MEIEVNGSKIQIIVRPLGDEMDTFLKKLFTMFFNEPLKPYNDFKEECFSYLEENINLYFDSKIKNTLEQDFLFTNLTVIWKFYQENRRVGEAQQFWQDILNIVCNWEEINNTRIHKGSLFYFWSMTAILQGQLEKGFFLIHSAYEEDVLTNDNSLPNTPAFKTVSLAYEDKDNLLFSLVTAWANYLEVLINV